MLIYNLMFYHLMFYHPPAFILFLLVDFVLVLILLMSAQIVSNVHLEGSSENSENDANISIISGIPCFNSVVNNSIF